MKRKAILLVGIILCFLLVGFVGNRFYGRLAAMVWHWRHGSSTQVADYEIPVPRQWFVANANATSVELVRAQDRGRAAFESRATASVLPKSAVDLSYWEGQQEASLRREGATTLTSREIPLGSNNRIACLEGELVRELLKVSSNLVSINCQSNDRLNLMFTGTPTDAQEFYGIVANIRVLRAAGGAAFSH